MPGRDRSASVASALQPLRVVKLYCEHELRQSRSEVLPEELLEPAQPVSDRALSDTQEGCRAAGVQASVHVSEKSFAQLVRTIIGCCREPAQLVLDEHTRRRLVFESDHP